jgi:hypothetical protein
LTVRFAGSEGFFMRVVLLRIGLTAAISLAAPAGMATSALAQGNDPELTAVRNSVAATRARLGDKAGVPEDADRVVAIPLNGRWLTRSAAMTGFVAANARIEAMQWWRIGLDPTTLERPLREPASVVAGCVAAYRAKLDGSDRSLAIARNAADFLIWAQDQAGTGVYPFPAARTGRSKAFQSANRYFARAEREGRLDQIVRNGWAINDDGDGGLQFDNGVAGLAMFELYEATRDARYLVSAKKSADWAITRPLVANWNYNSFSVQLLAKAHGVTGEGRYLEAAARKVIVGVIPGQLTDGPRAGRWVDPHNAKVEYHYIMMRALAQLAAAMPRNHADRETIMRSLELGLLARNTDFAGNSAPNKNSAMDALILVNRVFAADRDFLRRTLSEQALERLGVLVSEQARRGNAPLDPREWGLFLEFAAARPN